MQGKCQKKDCNRLIFDTEKTEELPARIECQHCHHVNTVSFILMSREEKRKRRAAVRAKNKDKAAAAPSLDPAPSTEPAIQPGSKELAEEEE